MDSYSALAIWGSFPVLTLSEKKTSWVCSTNTRASNISKWLKNNCKRFLDGLNNTSNLFSSHRQTAFTYFCIKVKTVLSGDCLPVKYVGPRLELATAIESSHSTEIEVKWDQVGDTHSQSNMLVNNLLPTCSANVFARAWSI